MFFGDSEEVGSWLVEGGIECGFLRMPTRREFETISIKKMSWWLWFIGHRITKEKRLMPANLQEELFILLEHGGNTDVSRSFELNKAKQAIWFTIWAEYAIILY